MTLLESILRGGSARAKPSMDLTGFIDKLIREAEPLSQNTTDGDLGFGWLYYGLVRNLRPDAVIAIGSRRGFMPFAAARAVQDNGRGQVVFIDPSYAGGGPPGWGGGDLWSDPEGVAERIASFGLTGWITHLKMRSDEAVETVDRLIGTPDVGLAIIDGSHTYQDSVKDFDLYATRFREGFAVFHDATSTWCEVPKTIHELRGRGYPVLTIHREVGLAIVELWRAPSVQRTWGYLCRPSTRGALIAEKVRPLLRADDQVLDVYCGCAPLADELANVAIFGCDRDAEVVDMLRARHPGHVWRQIDERQLPFAELPDRCDVLVGLGLSRGHDWWDPQHALANVHYLLGRYLPRVCVFETAADYYGADILADIEPALNRAAYSITRHVISTDMDSFARRALIVARRA